MGGRALGAWRHASDPHFARATPTHPPCAREQLVREEIFEVGPEGMSVQDLAIMLALQPAEIVKLLFIKVGG